MTLLKTNTHKYFADYCAYREKLLRCGNQHPNVFQGEYITEWTFEVSNAEDENNIRRGWGAHRTLRTGGKSDKFSPLF